MAFSASACRDTDCYVVYKHVNLCIKVVGIVCIILIKKSSYGINLQLKEGLEYDAGSKTLLRCIHEKGKYVEAVRLLAHDESG